MRRYFKLGLLYCMMIPMFLSAHLEVPQLTEYPLLVLACARSGTTYITQLLQLCGLQVGHESLGRDGMVCWTAIVRSDNPPWGPATHQLKFKHIVHQVRHPLKVISSVYFTEPPKSWNYIIFHTRQINQQDSHLVKCAKYWLYWNRKAEALSQLTYRVEDIEAALNPLSRLLQFPLDAKVLKMLSKTTNARTHLDFTWAQLQAELPPALYRDVRALAQKYGYSLDNES